MVLRQRQSPLTEPPVPVPRVARLVPVTNLSIVVYVDEGLALQVG